MHGKEDYCNVPYWVMQMMEVDYNFQSWIGVEVLETINIRYLKSFENPINPKQTISNMVEVVCCHI